MPKHTCPRCGSLDTVLDYVPERGVMALYCRCGYTDDPRVLRERIALGQDPITGKIR